MTLLFTEGFDNVSALLSPGGSSGSSLWAAGAVTGLDASLTVTDGTLSAVGVYILAGYSSGSPLSTAQVIFGHCFTTTVTYPANFGATVIGPTSSGGAFVAATAATVIAVQQCVAASDPTIDSSWHTIGTLSFAAGSHVMTFATTGGAEQNFAAGDYMQWIGPVVPDVTLTNIFASLAGLRA
jgi:hypothetical protein